EAVSALLDCSLVPVDAQQLAAGEVEHQQLARRFEQQAVRALDGRVLRLRDNQRDLSIRCDLEDRALASLFNVARVRDIQIAPAVDGRVVEEQWRLRKVARLDEDRSASFAVDFPYARLVGDK